MACEVNEGIAKSIYALYKEVKSVNPDANGIELFNKTWDKLYNILSKHSHVDNNDLEVYYKFLLSTIIDEYDLTSIANDSSFSELVSKFQSKEPDFTKKEDTGNKKVITNVSDKSTDDNSDSNVGTDEKPQVEVKAITKENYQNVPQSLLNNISKLNITDEAKSITCEYFNKVFSRLIEYANNNNESTIDLLKDLSDILSEALNNIPTEKVAGFGFPTFIGEIKDYFASNNILPGNNRVNNESIIRRCINDLYSERTDNTKKDEVSDKPVNLLNYLINANNAFYDSSYTNSGSHQGIFEIIDKLATKPSFSIQYKAFKISKLYNEFIANDNYKDVYIGDEIKNYYINGQADKNSDLDIRTRQFLNLVIDNTDYNDKKTLFDLAEKSSNETIRTTFKSNITHNWKNDIVYGAKQACYDIFKGNDVNAQNELLTLLDNLDLVLIVPFENDNIFVDERKFANAEFRNIKTSNYQTFEIGYYTSNGKTNYGIKSTSKLTREYSKDNLEEGRGRSTVILPLHSVSKKREGISTDESVNAVKKIVEDTKNNGVTDVNVEYTDGPINSWSTDTRYGLIIISNDGVNNPSIQVGVNQDKLSGEAIVLDNYKRKVLVTHKVNDNGVLEGYTEISLNEALIENGELLPDGLKTTLKKYIPKFSEFEETANKLGRPVSYSELYRFFVSGEKNSAFRGLFMRALGEYFSTGANVSVNRMSIYDTGYKIINNDTQEKEPYSSIITFDNSDTDDPGVMRSYLLNKEGVEFFEKYVTIKDNKILFDCYALPVSNIFTKTSLDIHSFDAVTKSKNKIRGTREYHEHVENKININSRKNVYIFPKQSDEVKNDNAVKNDVVEQSETKPENVELSSSDKEKLRKNVINKLILSGKYAKATPESFKKAVDEEYKKAYERELENRGLKQSRVYGMSIDAVEEDAQQALDWFNNSPLSSLVKISRAFDYADPEGFAIIHNAIISLYRGSNYTSLYHESWHELTQYCMTQKERNALYNELRKLNGTFKEFESGNKVKFSEATNLQLEELLAESFRHYMMTGKLLVENNLTFVQNGTKKTLLQFFKDILNYIKWHVAKFFNIDVANPNSATPLIDQMFSKLKNGQVKDYIARFNIENREFDVLRQSIFYADQSMIDLVSIDSLTEEGFSNLAKLYYSKNNIEITSENEKEKVKEFSEKYNSDETFKNEIYKFIIENNITPETDGFVGELSNKEAKFVGTVKIDGLYGLSENMSTYVMNKLKDLYVGYVKNLADESHRGFLYTLLQQNSLQDFFFKYLPTLQISDFGFSANDLIAYNFVMSNITATTLDVSGHKMGLWSPFVDYMTKELRDTPIEFEDIPLDEEDGKETYGQRDDIKGNDNDKSLKQMIKGQIRFILSLVKKKHDSFEYTQRMNAIITRVITLANQPNGPEKFYKTIFENRNDEYISQIIDIIGYPPIDKNEFEVNQNDKEFKEILDKAHYDSENTNNSKYDVDRVMAWRLFAESFSMAIRTPVLQTINAVEKQEKERNYDSDDEESQLNNSNYGQDYDSGYEEDDDVSSSNDNNKDKKKYKDVEYVYTLKLDDQQDREVVTILNSKLKSIEKSYSENFKNLGLIINVKSINNHSTINITVDVSGMKNVDGSLKSYYDIKKIIGNEYGGDNAEKVRNFFDKLGIKIKNTPIANDILKRYGASMITNVVTNLYSEIPLEEDGTVATDTIVTSISNIFDLVRGNTFLRLSKIMKAQEDIFSSFAAYNGENNLVNRHALNSYMTQITKILNDKDFVRDIDRMSIDDLVEKYSYMANFIDNPYWELFTSKEGYLRSLLLNAVIVSKNGVQRKVEGEFRNGLTPFNESSDMKVFTDMYLAFSNNIYTPIQWADKEPALAICAVGEDNGFLLPTEGYESVSGALIPIINCEIKRIKKTKEFYDNPSVKYNGNRNYLESGQMASFFEKLLCVNSGDGVYIINKLLDYDDDASIYLLNNPKVVKIVQDKLNKFFEEECAKLKKSIGEDLFKNIVLKPRGRFISKDVREEVEQYENTPELCNEVLLRKYVENDFLMGLYQCILLTGDLNNYDNFSKRNGPVISTGELQESDKFYENAINILNNERGDTRSYASAIELKSEDDQYDIMRSYDTVVVTDDIITSSKFNEYTQKYIGEGSYQKMETANAIGYITFDSYKRRLQKSNKWTKEQERLYQIIVENAEHKRKGELDKIIPISEQDVDIHFQPLKFQLSSPIASSPLDERTLLKNMYFPLIPTAIEGTGLEELHHKMIKDGIDMITVKNGSKLNEKTDHQGDLSSLFKFGYIVVENKDEKVGYWNDKVLNDSIRFVNIFKSPDGKDIVKNNGRSAIDRLKVGGFFYSETGIVAVQEFDYEKKHAVIKEKKDSKYEDAVEVIYTDEELISSDSGQTVILKVNRNEDGTINNLERCKLVGSKLVPLGDYQIEYNDKTRAFVDSAQKNVVISDNSFKVESKYFRDQLVIHNKAGNKISYYTQLRTQATSNMFEYGEIINSEDEKTVRRFENAFKELVDYHKQLVYKKICKTDRDGNLIMQEKTNKDGSKTEIPIIDDKKIIAYIRKEADMSKDISQEVYRSINEGNIVDFMNNSTYSSTITKLVIGRLSKDLANIKVYGDNLKQAPDLLFDKIDYNVEQITEEIVGNNSFESVKVGNIKNLKTLERDKKKRLHSHGMNYESDASESGFYSVEQIGKYQEMNPSKVQITFCDEFKNLKYHNVVIAVAKKLDVDLNNIHELCNVINLCLEIKNNIRKNKLDKISDMFKDENTGNVLNDFVFSDNEMQMFKLVGVRIPTQGYNFMDFMEIGRFIDPTLGPMIILSKEMVEKNGSDYDVDSMPISFPHINVTRDYEFDYANNTFSVKETSCNFSDIRSYDFIDEATDELKKLKKNLIYLTDDYDKELTEQRIADIFLNVFKHIGKDEGWVEQNVLARYIAELFNSNDGSSVKDVNTIFKMSEAVYDTFHKNNGSLAILFTHAKNANRVVDVLDESTQNNLNRIFDDLIANSDNDYDTYISLCEEFEEVLKVAAINSEDERKDATEKLLKVQNEINELYDMKKSKELNIRENDLLSATYNLLKLQTNWSSLLKKSDTHLFTDDGGPKESIFNEFRDEKSQNIYSPKDFAIELNGSVSEKNLDSMSKIGPSFNEFVRNSNNVSMTALGIAAVAAKWSVVWRRIGAELKSTFSTRNASNYKTTLLLEHDSDGDKIRLGGMRLKDDFDKSEIHDELISGFVDGAKDPWPALLGFNIDTIPIVEFLFWSGCRRDDVVSLVNYDSVKKYIAGIDSYKNGLGKFALGVTKVDSKMRINDFFENKKGIMSSKIQTFYQNVIQNYKDHKNDQGNTLTYPSFYDFAFTLLNAVDEKSFNRLSFVGNMIKNNGKEEYFKENGYGKLFKKEEGYMPNVDFKKKDGKCLVSICGYQVDLAKELNGTLDYNDLALFQYMMAEKMSNDITNFTTTFEADKNTYKSTAELTKYNSLFDKETQERSVLDYKDTFNKLVGRGNNTGTNLGVTFYNDVLFDIYNQFANGNGEQTNEVRWRENNNLNELLAGRLMRIKNDKEFYENMEGAKDKIFDYFFQNNLARRKVVESRQAESDTEKKLSSQRYGYYIESYNGQRTYVYDDSIMYSMYQRHNGDFSCYDEFRNFIFKRDEIYNRYKSKSTELINKATGNIVKFENLKTKMSGDILYDMVLDRIFTKFATIEDEVPVVNDDKVDIILSAAFSTYCYMRAQMEVFNFNGLFLKNYVDANGNVLPGKDNITYAELVNIITNRTNGLIERFPGLGSLFKVNYFGGRTSLTLTRQLDNNTSNDQFGDETSQFMDILTGPQGIQNKGILMSAVSKGNLSDVEFNNKIDSILWIMGLFQIYCQLQAGTGISGGYGLAKFGNDNFKKSITKDAMKKFITGIDSNKPESSIQLLDRILKYRMSSKLGQTAETHENYIERNFTGECLVDEAFTSSESSTISNNVSIDGLNYTITSPTSGIFVVYDSNNRIVDNPTVLEKYFMDIIREETTNPPENNGELRRSKKLNVDYIYLLNDNGKTIYTYFNGCIYKITYSKKKIEKEDGSNRTSKIIPTIENMKNKPDAYSKALMDKVIGLNIDDAFVAKIGNYLDSYKEDILNMANVNNILKDDENKKMFKSLYDNNYVSKKIIQYILETKLETNRKDIAIIGRPAFVSNDIESQIAEKIATKQELDENEKDYISTYFVNGSKNYVTTTEQRKDAFFMYLRDAVLKIGNNKDNPILALNSLNEISYVITNLYDYVSQSSEVDESDKKKLEGIYQLAKLNDQNKIFEIKDGRIGGTKEVNDTILLSINDGNTIELLVMANGYGFRSGTDNITVNSGISTLVDILLGKDTSKIVKYEHLEGDLIKSIKDTYSDEMKNAGNNRMFIYQYKSNDKNKYDLIVKFADEFYRVVSEDKKNDVNTITRFMDNIYVYNGSFLDSKFDKHIKHGGFQIVYNIGDLMSNAVDKNTRVLMDSELMEEIMNDPNYLAYLSTAMNIQVNSSSFEVDKSDSTLEHIDNQNECK